MVCGMAAQVPPEHSQMQPPEHDAERHFPLVCCFPIIPMLLTSDTQKNTVLMQRSIEKQYPVIPSEFRNG